MTEEVEFDKNNDRIVELNGFKLFVHDDYRPNRRNVICHSYNAKLLINFNNWQIREPNHAFLLGDMIVKNRFNDIKVIKVKGYY